MDMQKDLSALRKEELIAHREQLIKNISRYNNFQMAKKIQLNYAYGAL
jgi:predicted RNA-binding protein with PIN domain